MSENQGSFLGGFALGLFAGAAGYFMFATKDGSKIKETIKKEWQEAKDHLAEEGLIKDINISLSDMIHEWLDLKPEPKTSPGKKNTKVKTAKTAKFKGV